MRGHGLTKRVPASKLLDVTRRLCGLHAQVMSSAELTMWARTNNLKPDAIANALWDDRSLIKTWAMRGTLHLLPAEEYGLWKSALANYADFRKKAYLKYFGLTEKDLDRITDSIEACLSDEPRTREALAVAVGKATRSKKLEARVKESWGSLLKPAAFSGKLCYGPSTGQNVSFLRPGSWLQHRLVESDPHVALLDVLRRFIQLNGPTTREEFARWWGGVSPAAAGKLIAELGDEIVEVDVEGAGKVMLASDVKKAQKADASKLVNLLPAFDQYVLMSPREPAVLDPKMKERVFRKAAWLSPVLLVEGRIEGVWWSERKGKRLGVKFQPFTKQPAWVKRAAELEVQRLQKFWGGELEVTWA